MYLLTTDIILFSENIVQFHNIIMSGISGFLGRGSTLISNQNSNYFTYQLMLLNIFNIVYFDSRFK